MNLQEIAPYLAYKLQIIFMKSGIIRELTGIQITDTDELVFNSHTKWFNQNIWDFKPILHPLCDLTKPCLEGGKIPIVELAKIADRFSTYKKEKTFKNQTGQYSIWFYNKNGSIAAFFEYIPDEQSFHLAHGLRSETRIVHYQLQLFQKLYEWHFWLGDQSRFGQDIIDINTLES